MSQDIATRIRKRADEWVENCLDPQAMAHAVVAVLDELDRLSAHGDRRIVHIIGNLHGAIADELGIAPDSPAVASAGPQLTEPSAGEPTLTDPLIVAVGVELAGRVWDPPLPKLPVGQWTDIVSVIAKCVRDNDEGKRFIAEDTKFVHTFEGREGGECG